MRISLDGYDPKVRKVNRCRPTVSNKTILATKQKFCFTKAPPVQSITDIALLGFRLILHPGMFINFILHYHLFFRKEFFFEYLYFSEYDIRMFLFVWEIGHPLSTYATGGMEVGLSKMCTGAYRGRVCIDIPTCNSPTNLY